MVAQYIDGNGTVQTRLFTPGFAAADGTSATFTVPTYFNGAFSVRVAGSTAAPLLQIVPVLTSIDVTGANATQWRGLGLVEGNGTLYTIGSGSVTDSDVSATGVNVGGFFVVDNDGANVAMTAFGPGQASIRTAGGTSAPLAWNVINPALGANLYDVAFEASSGNLLVATSTEIKRLNAATGATLGSFAMPGGSSGNMGLQVVPAAFTLGSTAVPAGSLLVVNGGVSNDKIYALNATTGAVIATLDLGQNIDPVAGLYDPASGRLFLIDANPAELIEMNPANGTVVKRTKPGDEL